LAKLKIFHSRANNDFIPYPNNSILEPCNVDPFLDRSDLVKHFTQDITRASKSRKRRRSKIPERKFARSFEVDASDMLEVDLMSEWLDCLTGFGNYEAKKVQADARGSTFKNYFAKLEFEQQKRTADLVFESALGQLEATRWYVRPSLELMLELCKNGFENAFVHRRTELENMFLDQAALKAWLEARQGSKAPRGRAFLYTWRYAILLWNVLNALHSPYSSEVLTKLLKLHRVWREKVRSRNTQLE
jgi:hypothetical protein